MTFETWGLRSPHLPDTYQVRTLSEDNLYEIAKTVSPCSIECWRAGLVEASMHERYMYFAHLLTDPNASVAGCRPQKVVVQVSIGLGALAALTVSADAISGERERGTLEALLVTPVSRRGLIAGKLLAANTMWIAALVVAIPYTIALADGPGVTADALGVLLLVGTLVSIALTALGLAVSALSMSNRTSLAVAVGLLLVLAAPSQLPAVTADGIVGSILIRSNPVSAGLKLAGEVLIAQQSWASQWTLIVAPAVASVLLTVLAVRRAHRLELGGAQ